MDTPRFIPARLAPYNHVPYHAYATHQPTLLEWALKGTGDILETGCGFYSTPILKAVAKARRCRLFSLVEDMKWAELVKSAGYTDVIIQVDFNKPIIPQFMTPERIDSTLHREIDTVFIDHERTPKDRLPVIKEIMVCWNTAIVHDANHIDLSAYNVVWLDSIVPETAVITRK